MLSMFHAPETVLSVVPLGDKLGYKGLSTHHPSYALTYRAVGMGNEREFHFGMCG